MKKNLLVIGVLAGVMLMTAYAGAVNLVPNGAMNTTDKWYVGEWDATSHTGPMSAVMDNNVLTPAFPWAWFSASDLYFTLVAEGQYKFTTWVKGDNFVGTLQMGIIDAEQSWAYRNDHIIWRTITAIDPINSLWTPLTINFTVDYAVGQTGAYFVMGPFYGIDGSATGRILFDDVSVVLVEPPVAIAGPDQVVEIGLVDLHNEEGTTTLDGSASYDPDGTSLSYEWKYGTTPIGNTAIVEVSVPFGSTRNYTLTVTDADGLTNSDDVEVRHSTENLIKDLIDALPRGLLKQDTAR